jgi:hypothetical protein
VGKKTKIIDFPSKFGTSSPPVFQDDVENLNDYEGYEDEEYFYLLEEKDERFIANDPEDQEMLRAVRKKDLKKLRKDK